MSEKEEREEQSGVEFARAWVEWIEGSVGVACADPDTLPGRSQVARRFLVNRLWEAFNAGASIRTPPGGVREFAAWIDEKADELLRSHGVGQITDLACEVRGRFHAVLRAVPSE